MNILNTKVNAFYQESLFGHYSHFFWGGGGFTTLASTNGRLIG